MCYQVLRIVFLAVAVVALGFSASASEEASEEKKTADKPEIKREEDWMTVQARVSALETKVKSGQEEINKLILEKNHTKDAEHSNAIVKQIMGLHTELKKNIQEYDQQRSLLKYRYPERGLKEERVYQRIELKSLEQMENEMSLTSSVNRTLKRVRSQYETSEEKKTREDKAIHSEATKAGPPPGLVDPVILKK